MASRTRRRVPSATGAALWRTFDDGATDTPERRATSCIVRSRGRLDPLAGPSERRERRLDPLLRRHARILVLDRDDSVVPRSAQGLDERGPGVVVVAACRRRRSARTPSRDRPGSPGRADRSGARDQRGRACPCRARTRSRRRPPRSRRPGPSPATRSGSGRGSRRRSGRSPRGVARTRRGCRPRHRRGARGRSSRSARRRRPGARARARTAPAGALAATPRATRRRARPATTRRPACAAAAARPGNRSS